MGVNSINDRYLIWVSSIGIYVSISIQVIMDMISNVDIYESMADIIDI
jgi:hypothetical protein